MSAPEQLKQFCFDRDQRIRVLGTPERPLFVAKDVCRVLGIKESRSVLRSLDEDEKGVHSVHSLGGAQKMNVVTESGLYALIFKSRKPEAKRFRRWVTEEVLPEIRKTGGFRLEDLSHRDLLGLLVESETAGIKAEEAMRMMMPSGHPGELSEVNGRPRTQLVRSYWRSDPRSSKLGFKDSKLVLLLDEYRHMRGRQLRKKTF